MTAENFDSLLEEFLDAKPFRVFTVEMNGGKQFEIDYPRAVVLRNGVAVFLAPGGIPKYFDHKGVNHIAYASVNDINGGNPNTSTA